ncbi:MAG TPA: hypothetical protein VGD55_11000, partial [Acidothermaceae bacterium]
GRRGVAAAFTAGVVTAGALTACGSHSTSASDTAGAISVPLATSVVTSSATWATFAMGHLDDPENTFWEEFTLPTGADQWVERTPVDVADNGGLVTAPTSDGVVVGFRPSADLKFSPLASTSDDGATYTPGLLSDGLANVPDALSVTASGHAAALTSTEVMTSGAMLSAWEPVTTLSAISTSSVGQSCGVQELTGVLVTENGLFVGAACSSPGVVGLLQHSGSAFVSAGLRLPSGDAQARISVLRLVQYKGTIAVLLGVRTDASTSYVAAWNPAPGSAAWTVSPPLTLPGALVSTAVTGDGSYAMMTSDNSGLRAALIAERGTSWTQLPPPPAGTATLAVSKARTDALVVDSATFIDYQLTDGQWVKGQTTQVAIPYGSSG